MEFVHDGKSVTYLTGPAGDRRLKALAVSCGMFAELMAGTPAGRAFRIISGVPAHAHVVRVYIDHARDMIVAVYRDPSFDMVPSGGVIPMGGVSVSSFRIATDDRGGSVAVPPKG